MPSNSESKRLYMKKLEPEFLREIESIRVVGPCKVTVARFGMRRATLGGVHLAWGKTRLDDHDALAVATETSDGRTMLSINFSGSGGSNSAA